MNKRKFGLFITELRKTKNMTQEEVGEKLFIDRTTVSKWERGDYIPNPEMLLSLSHLFDVSVNELLLGEKMTIENKEEVNNVTVEVLKDSRKKVKKALLGSVSIIGILLFVFLGYYFINTYNSIKVYKINGENGPLYMEDGIMIVSREKSYIKLGKMNFYDKTKPSSFKLYYVKDNKQHNIYTSSEVDMLVTNLFDYDELFKYKDIEYLKNNLFLEIMFEDSESITINLQVTRDFSNGFFFKKKVIPEIKKNDNLEDTYNIPKYIKNTFILDKNQELYYFDSEENNIKIHQKYIYNLGLYIVEEEVEDVINHFEYSIDDGNIIYYKIENFEMTENASYSLFDRKCISEECNIEIINDFIKKYIDFIE